MKRTDFLITKVRELSRNGANPDGSFALANEEILQYINDAQDRIQSLISVTKSPSNIFCVSKEIATVANQEDYELTDRVFYNKEIKQVEFSASGALSDYQVLRKLELFNRRTYTTNFPYGYYRRGGKIVPIPTISVGGGKLRVMYERTLDDLDIRRGKVSVVTGLTSTGFTSITLDSTADETSTPNLSSIDYICIVDIDGTVKTYNIPVGGYNTGTNVLTPRAGFTFQTGETIAVDDYVVFGKYTTTHSRLPDSCERYLIHYSVTQVLGKDSSTDMTKHNALVADIEEDIVRQIRSQTNEIQSIPELNRDEWWV